MKDWPKPRTLDDELPPVEAFAEDLLPESLRPIVVDVSERMHVPMDFTAVTVMVALAGAVSRRARIQPKVNDTGWLVVPNLWGGLVGFPGTKKTPAMNAMLRPLQTIEGECLAEYQEAMDKYQRATEAHKGNRKRKEGLEQPTAKRFIVNDPTPEKLHELMRSNPGGLLMVRDELSGLLAGFSQHGRETERAFYLVTSDGDTGYTIDRIGRGTVHAEACCLSLIGGIQPELLKTNLMRGNGTALQNDGLMQRCSMMVWPDAMKRAYIDRAPDDGAQHLVEQIFRRLTDVDPENPLLFRFAPDAQEIFKAWHDTLDAKIDSEGKSVIASHLNKYPKLMATLALLCELADRAASGFEGFEGLQGDGLISYAHVCQSVQWCCYLESHARRIYSCIGTPEQRSATILAERIKRRDIGTDGHFTLHDLKEKDWGGLTKPGVISAALAILEKANWIRDATQKPGPHGGRPSIRFEVNPLVWE